MTLLTRSNALTGQRSAPVQTFLSVTLRLRPKATGLVQFLQEDDEPQCAGWTVKFKSVTGLFLTIDIPHKYC